MSPRNDVAIYSPYASQLYERDVTVSGGAELQMVMLAERLAARGLRCAPIVLPLRGASADLPSGIQIVERQYFAGGSTVGGKVRESGRMWRALRDADARTYVFRGAWPALGVAAVFCRRHGRRLVFSCTSDRNFVSEARGLKRADHELYRLGARRSDAIVAQTESQAVLARAAFPSARRVVVIPSFAEPAEQSAAPPEAFLWTGRLIDYKNPDAYVELARAVPEARFWMIPKFVEEDPDTGRRLQAVVRELPNLELLEARPRPELMELVDRSVAIVNTSPREGMPNLFLEGWARGIPALTFEFDPDGRIEREGLGAAAQGSAERFAKAARELWESRHDRTEVAQRVRAYVARTHSPDVVAGRWADLLEDLR